MFARMQGGAAGSASRRSSPHGFSHGQAQRLAKIADEPSERLLREVGKAKLHRRPLFLGSNPIRRQPVNNRPSATVPDRRNLGRAQRVCCD